ncbi:MAG: ATP-binding protein, partial [Acidobacteria bacterium]|nr:ATP-binding protein [Acidobacteriota bacterium]
LIYGVFAAGLVVIVLALGFFIGRRILSPQNGATWIVLLVIGMAAGFWFRPLRDTIALWVDRSFFKLSHNYRVGLLDLRRRLEDASSTEEAAAHLDRFLETALQPNQHAAVIEWRGRHCKAGTIGDASLTACLCVLSERGTTSEALAAPGTTSFPGLEIEPFPETLGQAGIVFVQPLPTPHVRGWLLLGPKRSGWRYVEVDVRMIQDVAVLTAEVLEKLFWIQAAAEEAMERSRLAELDLMKNEFLSRVAHDLRTPLASIAWSTENLIDGLDGGDGATRSRYLRSIKISAVHLNRLVHNLLELSRLEKGATHVETETVSLDDVVERAIAAVLPLAEEKEVRFEVQTEKEPVLVRADSDKLLEVVLNLFDNALKYSPRGHSIQVRTERNQDGAALTVRDHGPGLGTASPTDLFLRYRQGASSPHASQE